METKPYVMGNVTVDTWRNNEAQQLTFVVTQECNLRCKYCYMVEKNNKHVMNFDTAKKIIDYFVDNKESLFLTDYLVLDFIGGEPLLEIELVDKIVDYFRITTYQKKSRWFGRFRISVQSNGILVDTEDFQKFLRKNWNMVSVGITIDGTERKHNLQRVFPNGEGSYSIVERNYKKMMQKSFVRSTKVTFAHDDLKYIKESIIHLWSMGIKNVPANIVFENVWEEGDDAIYEKQLVELADYAIDHDLWKEYNTTLFSDELGFKVTEDVLMSASCGIGNMYCVDDCGDIYNCVRFMDYSLNGKKGKKIGDIYNGIDFDKRRALQVVFPKYISDEKCLKCRISRNCSYCAGNNYDASDTCSMFYRSVAICDMHKARVRANNYFWARLYNEHSVSRQVNFKNEYFMYILLSSDCIRFCDFPKVITQEIMSPENLISGLEYAFRNFYQPVFVHSDDSSQRIDELLQSVKYGEELSNQLTRHVVRHIMKYKKGLKHKNAIYVLDDSTDELDTDLGSPVILTVEADKIDCLAERVGKILPFVSRISINILNVDFSFDLGKYEEQLKIMTDNLYAYLSIGKKKEVRQLTDRIFVSKMNNCFAGEKNITFAPDGQFYFCPAFYFDKELSIDFEKLKNQTYLGKAPLCSHCDAYQCSRCVYRNVVGTGELNVPTSIQCKMAHLERKYSAKLLEMLKMEKIEPYSHINISTIDYDDPIGLFSRKRISSGISCCE